MAEVRMLIKKFQPDKNFVKGEAEHTTILRAVLKKESYTSEKDGHNLKPGTGNPWGSISITGFDPASFLEFAGAQLGDEVIVTFRPAKVKK